MSRGIGYVLAAVVLAALLLMICIAARRRRRLREVRRRAEDRLREEALDKVLTGGRADAAKSAGPSVPFDVKYGAGQRKRSGQTGHMSAAMPLMLHLTEHSELSTREYMFHVADHITLGQASRNDIVVKGARIADSQCEIFRIQKALYVKNTGTGGLVFLIRKNRKIMVDAQAVILENRDTLQVGGYTYEVELLQSLTRT